MDEQDPYKVLGVGRGASAEEIRKAYKKLSRENHPDMKPNDPAAAEKFRQVQDAYEVLGTPEKREQYDRYGSAFRGQMPPGGGPGPGGGWTWTRGPGGSQAGPVDLGDMFGGAFDLDQLFGGGMGGGAEPGAGGARGTRRRRGTGGRPRAAAPPAEETRLEIEVPFQTAVEGGSVDLRLDRGGPVEELAVRIPPGVDTGSVIRLAGQGQPSGLGGPPGDLLLTLKVAPHPWFRREGRNLLLDVPITPSEAALGAKVEVPTLSEGTVVVTVPPGTSGGMKLRLRGKGVPDRKTGERGDQFVVLKIVLPPGLDEKAKALFEELARLAPHDPRRGLW